MKKREIENKPNKSGIIPYYIKDGKVFVKVMKPSDPDFGGTEWQMAKGKIEKHLTPEENALKEGHEEVGLKASNIIQVHSLMFKNRIYVFTAEIQDPHDFDKPHWETGAVTWLQLPKHLDKIRSSQREIFRVFHQRISADKD